MRISFIKPFTCIALAFVLCFSLCSCSGSRNTESFDDLCEVISEYEEMVSRQEEEKADKERHNFVIVIPTGCGAEVFDSAVFLSDVMSKFVGYEVEVYYDTDLIEKSSNFEILIGSTDREKSKRFMKELRSIDYGYEYCDGAVTIGGHSDATVSRAIASFAEKIQSGRIDPVSINALKPYFERGEYSVREAKLGGFLLSEYVIVYPNKNNENEYSVAKYLASQIEEKFGYTLRVISDKEVRDTERAICVGKGSLVSSVVTSSATLSASDRGNIELLAQDSYGLKLVADEFLKLMAEGVIDESCDVHLSGMRSYAYQNDEISFYFVRDDFLKGSVESYKSVTSDMRYSSVSVFDRLSSSVSKNIRNNVGQLLNAQNQSFYYFDTANQRCVEAKSETVGEGEIFTLVMERANGDRFAFIGGFCNDDANEKSDVTFSKRLAEECEKYSYLPIIVAHEMNSVLDRELADTNSRLVAVDGTYGVYFSCDSFELVRSSRSAVEETLYADVVTLKMCYK